MPPAKAPATPPARRRGWRILLTTFKWCRISLLLLLLVVIVLGLFLHHVGLPDWLERRVEAQFRAHGWDVKFSRLRLRWYHGIVAEDLQLQRTNTFAGPHVFLPTAEFRLNSKALRRLALEADSVMLRGGRLFWPLPDTNQPRRTLALHDAGGELLFKTGDHWELKFLEAHLLGAHVRVRGDLTNASLLREWKLPARPPRPGAAPEALWHRLLDAAEKVRFTGTPELSAICYGDARDWKSFEAQCKFTAHAVESPWGSGTHVALAAHLLPPPRSNDAVRLDLTLTAQDARHRRATATNLNLTVVAEPSFTHWLPTNTLALLELRGVKSDWGAAARLFLELRSRPAESNAAFNQTRLDLTLDQPASSALQAGHARLTATGVHSATNLLPATFDTVGALRDARSRWATSQWTEVRTKLDLPNLAALRLTETNLPWPERLRNLPLAAGLVCSNAAAPGLEMDHARLQLRWRFPLLELETDSAMTAGSADLQLTLDTATRESRFRAKTRLVPPQLAPFLGTNAQRWLSFVAFDAPPRIQVEGRVLLPAWTNRPPEWSGEALPTLSLAGQFSSESGSCRGVPFTSIHAPFTLTNLSWTLPGARVARREGALRLAGAAEQRTGEFHGTVHSDFDLMALRPAFPQKEPQRTFGFFEFSTPPRLTADVRGNWRDFTTVSASGGLALTNAAFRGQAVKACVARVTYTNRFLSILQPLVLREGEQATAAGIGIDLARPRLFLTNAVGRLSARAVTKCIGPETDRTMAPFIFDLPPDARAEGSVPLGKSDKTEDMRFDIDGGTFHWLRFHLDRARATLLWRGETLTITNLQGRWRGADVDGWVRFQFTPKGQADLFSFHVRVEGTDLRAVLRDLQPDKTNKVEGTMSGELTITRADTLDWKSWQGHGHARLTNGLLWEIPIFGVFSPILNTILPGLGNSRARHADATYLITNSVIHTKDLEIRATAMRMNYEGWVDFERQVEGKMQAELFRDVPAFGFLISKILWPVTKLFEYKITGTLDDPKTRELYFVPRVLLMPLRPFKTLKDFLSAIEGTEQKPPAPPAKPAE
jgi:hypothetical protein